MRPRQHLQVALLLGKQLLGADAGEAEVRAASAFLGRVHRLHELSCSGLGLGLVARAGTEVRGTVHAALVEAAQNTCSIGGSLLGRQHNWVSKIGPRAALLSRIDWG